MEKTIIKTISIVIICLTIGFFAGTEYKTYQVNSQQAPSFKDQLIEVLNELQDIGYNKEQIEEKMIEEYGEIFPMVEDWLKINF